MGLIEKYGTNRGSVTLQDQSLLLASGVRDGVAMVLSQTSQVGSDDASKMQEALAHTIGLPNRRMWKASVLAICSAVAGAATATEIMVASEVSIALRILILSLIHI